MSRLQLESPMECMDFLLPEIASKLPKRAGKAADADIEEADYIDKSK